MKFGDYDTFSFVDVETTGTSASQDRVLEIGIIRVEDGVVVGELNTLLDPGVYIPPEITMITGIKEDDLFNAPTFPDVVDKVQELLEGAIFVAHNARFDHAFIKHEFRRLGLPFNPKTLDTVKLSRRVYPFLGRHNLDSIINFLGISVENRHRAYDDASVLHSLLKRIEVEFPKETTEPIFREFLRSPSLPTQITKKQIEELTEGPGVYLMYNNETLLYVGKSVDIRARVLSHFYNDFDSATDLKLSREVNRIETIKTAGDLGASLLESELIKTRLPIYNRALRRNQGLLVALEIEKDGYFTIEIKDIKEVKKDEISKVLFVSSSKKQMSEIIIDKAKQHKLCLKLLGLEKGSGNCFGCQIEQCFGACMKDEPSFKYNVRFIQAFHEKKIKDWPFTGAIGLKEKFEEVEEIHVVYNWCYMGSIKHESEDLSEISNKELVFKWDNYKILSRFIKKEAYKNRLLNLPFAG